jgi:hypothetical protein
MIKEIKSTGINSQINIYLSVQATFILQIQLQSILTSSHLAREFHYN